MQAQRLGSVSATSLGGKPLGTPLRGPLVRHTNYRKREQSSHWAFITRLSPLRDASNVVDTGPPLSSHASVVKKHQTDL
jgi:hypothetical protein